MDILFPFLPFAALIPIYAWFRRIDEPARKTNTGYAMVAMNTLAYWVWEFFSKGGVRLDILVIFPYLALVYVMFLWPRWKWWSLLWAILLMAGNIAYFGLSLALSGKPIQ